MRKIWIWLLASCLLTTGAYSASALLSVRVGGAFQTISSIVLSNNTFVGGSPTATVVGAITVNLTPASPPFSGTLSLSGTDAPHFAIDTSNNLITNGIVAVGTYNINIVAMQPSLVNTGFSIPVVITGTSSTQTISSVVLTGSTFVGGSPSGTVVGTIATTMSPTSPAFSGTYSLGGPDAASFQIVGSSLETNGVVSSGTYSINIIAVQGGAIGSPFTLPATITGSGQSIIAVSISNNSFTAGSPSGTVVGSISTTMSPSTPTFSGTYSLTGTNAASFQLSGSNLETNGVLCGSPPCSYSLNIVATQGGATGSPFTQPISVTSAASGVVSTGSFLNSASSTTPGSVVPVMRGFWVPPASVPSGMHAVPSVNGTTLAQWQLDSIAVPWPDGSTRGGGFSGFLPAPLAAGARQTVTWTLTSGAWPSMTPATLANVVAGGPFEVLVTNATTAWMVSQNHVPNGTVVGFTVPSGTGAVTEVHLNQNPITGASCGAAGTSGCGPTNVNTISGCATAPQFYLNAGGSSPNMPTSVTLLAAGAGCPTVGSGGWTASASAIAAGLSGTMPACASTTISQVCQYAGGLVKDAFKFWGYYTDNATAAWVTGTPYTTASSVVSFGNTYQPTGSCTSGATPPVGVVNGFSDGGCTWNVVIQPFRWTAWIEVWKNAGSGVFGYNVMFETDPDNYIANSTTKAYTVTANCMAGATNMRGAGTGDLGYQGIGMIGQLGGWFCADKVGLPFWVIGGSITNSDAYNAVIVSDTTSDKVYDHANEAIVPIANYVPPVAQQVLIHDNLANWGSMNNDAAHYEPYCYCDVETNGGISPAGSHGWTSNLTQSDTMHYLVQDVASDGGESWLQSARMGAMGQFGTWLGPRENLTNNPINTVPGTAWTPPANFTDPVRTKATCCLNAGTIGFDMDYGAGIQQAWPGDTQHWGNWGIYPYVVEGRRYMLDMEDYNAQAIFLAQVSLYNRSPTLNATSTTYWGSVMASPAQRQDAWLLHGITFPAYFLPPGEPNNAYWKHLLDEQYIFLHDWQSYIGTWQLAINSGQGGTRLTSMAPVNLSSFTGNFINVPGGSGGHALSSSYGTSAWFVSTYLGFAYNEGYMWNGGTSGSIISSLATYIPATMSTSIIADLAQSCPYNAFTYTFPWLSNYDTQTTFPSTDASTLAATGRPNQFNLYYNTWSYSPGSSTIYYTFNPKNGGAPNNNGAMASPSAASSGTTLTFASNTINYIAPNASIKPPFGVQIVDISTPTNVPPNTYVTGETGSTIINTSQTTTIPAPVTTTTTAGASGSAVVHVASTAGITPGLFAQDLTTPTALAGNGVSTPYQVASIDPIGLTVTLKRQSNGTPVESIASGDTLQFSDILAFSLRYDVPSNNQLVVGTPIANGSYFWIMNTNQSRENVNTADPEQIGTFPPASIPQIKEGQAYLFTPDPSGSGTAGKLTTLSTDTPPNTDIVFSQSGASQFGFINNATCPTPSLWGTMANGLDDYHNNGDRVAEGWAVARTWLALNPSDATAIAAVAALTPYQTPINTVFGALPMWNMDGHF